MTNTTDSQLLSNVAADKGRDTAFAEIHTRYATMIRDEFRRKGIDADTTHDLTQYVFIKFFRSAKRIKKNEDLILRQALRQIAKSIFRDYLKDKKRRPPLKILDCLKDIVAAKHTDQVQTELADCIEALSPHHKKVINLFLLGHTKIAAAEIMGCSQTQYRRDFNAAVKHLRELMEDYPYGSMVLKYPNNPVILAA